MGPATLKELEVVTSGYKSVTWHIVRNWVGRGFATWETCRGGGRRGLSRWREVALTDEGRRDLWRYAWVTRRLRFSDWQEAPLREDVPEDALDALRLHARTEFLRPAALALLEELMGWPGQNLREMGEHTELYATLRGHVRNFRVAGFLADGGQGAMHVGCFKYPRWRLNEAGIDALDRHIDALRRAGIASGYVPTKSCEYYYPNEHVSPCATSRGSNIERCSDCWHVEKDELPD